MQQSTDNLEKASKEKEQLYEELNEKERQANSQDLVSILSIGCQEYYVVTKLCLVFMSQSLKTCSLRASLVHFI